MAVATSLLGSISEAPVPTPSFSVEFGSHFEDQAGHTVYEVEVTAPDGASWAMHKRYSEVRELHDTLRLWLQDKLPPIPGRRLFGNHDPIFIEERRLGLQRYLNGTLHIIASQMPSLQGFVGQFLGWDQSFGSRRGRTLGAAHRKGKDSSVSPAPRGWSFGRGMPTPRAVSLDCASAMPSHGRMRLAQEHHPHVLSRSMTPSRNQGSVSHSMPPGAGEVPAEGCRVRRWSRQQQSTEAEAASERGTGGYRARSAVRGGAALEAQGVENGAQCRSESAGQEDPEPCRSPSKDVEAENRSEGCASPVQGVGVATACLEAATAAADIAANLEAALPHASREPSPPPHGESWDWPLTRHEKKERLRLIDQQMTDLDQKALIGEIEQLRSEFPTKPGRVSH